MLLYMKDRHMRNHNLESEEQFFLCAGIASTWLISVILYIDTNRYFKIVTKWKMSEDCWSGER